MRKDFAGLRHGFLHQDWGDGPHKKEELEVGFYPEEVNGNTRPSGVVLRLSNYFGRIDITKKELSTLVDALFVFGVIKVPKERGGS